MNDPLDILGKKFKKISHCIKQCKLETVDNNLLTDLQSGKNIDQILGYFAKLTKIPVNGMFQDKKVYVLCKIELINKRLEKIFTKTEAAIRFFQDSEQMIKNIDKKKIYAIVCDWDYGESAIIAMLKQIRMIHPQVIIIILLNDDKRIDIYQSNYPWITLFLLKNELQNNLTDMFQIFRNNG